MRWMAEVPYDIRDSAITEFMIAYSTERKKYEKRRKAGKTVKEFEMHFRRKKEKVQESFTVPHKHLKIKHSDQCRDFKRDNCPYAMTCQCQGKKCNPHGQCCKTVCRSGSCPCQGRCHKLCEEKCSNYCFPRLWQKELLGTFKEKLPCHINHDCRLIRTVNNRYYLAIPTDIEKPGLVFRRNYTVALDPGERLFQACYDTEGNAYIIGEGDSQKFDELSKRAGQMRAGKARIYTGKKRDRKKKEYRITTDKKKLKGLRKAAAKVERKIKNMISDIHRKTAKFLVKRYDTILIPKFRSQQMAKKRQNRGQDTQSSNSSSQTSQNNSQWRTISKGTTRRMLQWSHYKFRELLKSKAKTARKKVFVVEEPLTTKTCGNCFHIKWEMRGERIYVCKRCGSRFHRDVNAGRNVILENWEKCGLRFVTF